MIDCELEATWCQTQQQARIVPWVVVAMGAEEWPLAPWEEELVEQWLLLV